MMMNWNYDYKNIEKIYSTLVGFAINRLVLFYLQLMTEEWVCERERMK